MINREVEDGRAEVRRDGTGLYDFAWGCSVLEGNALVCMCLRGGYYDLVCGVFVVCCTASLLAWFHTIRTYARAFSLFLFLPLFRSVFLHNPTKHTLFTQTRTLSLSCSTQMQERLFTHSDKYRVHVCDFCGFIAIANLKYAWFSSVSRIIRAITVLG